MNGGGELSLRQESFCQEYIKDKNGAQAAIRAGYSKRAAREVASEVLAYPNVSKRIETLCNKVAERNDLTADKVMAGIERIATNCEESHPAVALRARELQAKYLGILTDKVEVSGTVEMDTKFFVEFVPAKAIDITPRNDSLPYDPILSESKPVE